MKEAIINKKLVRLVSRPQPEVNSISDLFLDERSCCYVLLCAVEMGLQSIFYRVPKTAVVFPKIALLLLIP